MDVISQMVKSAINQREQLIMEIMQHFNIRLEELVDRCLFKQYPDGRAEVLVDGKVVASAGAPEFGRDGDKYFCTHRIRKHWKEDDNGLV